jgi:hypothetical protein
MDENSNLSITRLGDSKPTIAYTETQYFFYFFFVKISKNEILGVFRPFIQRSLSHGKIVLFQPTSGICYWNLLNDLGLLEWS